MANISYNPLEESAGDHDRISLEALSIFVVAPETDAFAFFSQLSQLRSLYDDEGPTLLQTPQRPFNRIEVSFTSRIRSNRNVVGAPLMDGKLIFHRTNAPIPDELSDDLANGTARGTNLIRFTGKAEITVNPTRAFAHQDHAAIARNPAGFADLPIRTVTQELPAFFDERPINPIDDNVLYHPRQQRAARSIDMNQFTDRYIAQVLEEIRGYIVTARNETRRQEHRVHTMVTPYANVKEVETYWTLPTATPFNDLMEVEPRFRGLGAESQRRVYRNVVADLERQGNVPSVSTRLLTGVRAKLYPKTNQSLRLEVVHKLRHCESLGLRHTCATERVSELVDHISEVLRACREQAQEQALQLVAHLQADEENQTHQPPYRLIAEIIRAAQQERDQNLLMEVIIHNGSYTGVPGDQLRRAIETLRRRGVLERIVRNGRTLRVTAQYEQARQILANHTSLTDITTEADFVT